VAFRSPRHAFCCTIAIGTARPRLRGVRASGASAMTGELAALAAALAFGLSTVMARRFMDTVAPEAGVLVSIVTNVAVFAALTVATALRHGLPTVTLPAVALFILGGLAGTLLGRNLSYRSIERLGPSLLTTIRFSQTIFTLLLGLFLLHELPRPWQLAGLAVLMLGLWISLSGAPASPRSVSSQAPAPARRDLAALMIAFASAAAFALGDTVRRAALGLLPSPVLGAAIGASSALAAHLLWSIIHRSARWPARPALRRFDLWISAIFNTIAILLLYTGLRYAPVAIVSVLYNLQVFVVLAGSRVLLRGQEAIGRGLVAGSILALTGTAMILMG
jgi:drug/metabolite transporter (DMT)-like permease